MGNRGLKWPWYDDRSRLVDLDEDINKWTRLTTRTNRAALRSVNRSVSSKHLISQTHFEPTQTDPSSYRRMPVSFPSSSSISTARQQSTKTPSPPSTSSISSYPSSISSSSDSSSDSDEEDEEYERALIQEEWNESMKQMQMLFSLVLMPFFGRWWGRRWSYWGKFSSRNRLS